MEASREAGMDPLNGRNKGNENRYSWSRDVNCGVAHPPCSVNRGGLALYGLKIDRTGSPVSPVDANVVGGGFLNASTTAGTAHPGLLAERNSRTVGGLSRNRQTHGLFQREKKYV